MHFFRPANQIEYIMVPDQVGDRGVDLGLHIHPQ